MKNSKKTVKVTRLPLSLRLTPDEEKLLVDTAARCSVRKTTLLHMLVLAGLDAIRSNNYTYMVPLSLVVKK